ncbi:MAG TPA: hypothetical protein VHE33_12790 [Acidobacteriaceae bacterium]|nr:hypothetical protein [Acidobacteriaceae bacterium]
MINPNDPPRGSMYLYDDIQPATVDGQYKLTVSTDISWDSNSESAPIDRYLNIVGPRFSLDPTLVANVYPPRNGQGAFQDAIPQIVLSRRTLPWERDAALPAPVVDPSLPAQNGQVPWVALLLFQDGEPYTLLQNQHLVDVVGTGVFHKLGSPANVLCDAVELDRSLLTDILPTSHELRLLSHVRQVNVEDRELSAGSSDGFFSVVMSNRLPSPETKYRACLVSLEQRADLLQPLQVPPVLADAAPGNAGGNIAAREIAIVVRGPGSLLHPKVRLVLLHTWQFTCTGPGPFRKLMQALDVGMIGKVATPGQPALTDTGHLRLSIQDRAGTTEVGWYRGPLVPWQLTRDPLGPYHSADQCRRATVETGAEDVSYAAAFEVGRQLAAADGQLARELMRWRTEAYRQANRADNITQKIAPALAVDLPATLAEQLHTSLPPLVSVSATEAIAKGAPGVADRYRIDHASQTVGMDPQVLSEVWSLASTAEAQILLGSDPSTLGATVAEAPQTVRSNTTLEQVAADTGSLSRLSQARNRILTNATVVAQNNTGGKS